MEADRERGLDTSTKGVMRLRMLLLFFFAVWKTSECVPVPVRIVDLTQVFDNTIPYRPHVRKFEINVTTVDVPNSDLRVQIEEFATATHIGTHVDAPCHVAPNRHRIEDIPLNRMVAPAAVVDIREKVHLNKDYELDIEDLLEWENTTHRFLNDVILLVRSRWSDKWPNRTEYTGFNENDVIKYHFPGISPSAATWLTVNRNVYGVGVETLSLDHGPSKKFEAHQILLDKNMYGIENMGSMEELPIYGATVYVMPMKLDGACGAPCRIIATVPDVIYGP